MQTKLNLESPTQTCCPVHVTLPEQSPITCDEASELEDLFKILANDTRLRLLHTLARVEEMCVCDLASSVGMTPQAISNMIYYRVVDQCIIELLQKAMCLLSDSAKQNKNLKRRRKK